jgi:hypothetical protein
MRHSVMLESSPQWVVAPPGVVMSSPRTRMEPPGVKAL